MDSNHDKQIQNLQCYRYTTRQMGTDNYAEILVGRKNFSQENPCVDGMGIGEIFAGWDGDFSGASPDMALAGQKYELLTPWGREKLAPISRASPAAKPKNRELSQ